MKFLKDDPRAGKLWADHHDLQIVANAYGIKVHILTVGVVSKDGPKARWTHLDPDGRLGSLDANASKMYGDIWLLHQDSTHFDLIIKNDSILAQKDGIFHEKEENPKKIMKLLLRKKKMKRIRSLLLIWVGKLRKMRKMILL